MIKRGCPPDLRGVWEGLECGTFELDFEDCVVLLGDERRDRFLGGSTGLVKGLRARQSVLCPSVLVYLWHGPCGAEVGGVKVQRAGGVSLG